MPPTKTQARRRRVVAAIGLIAAGVVTLLLLLGGEDERKLVPGGGGDSEYDPLAYDPAKEADLEIRAASGLGDVLYDRSPGGVPASAERTARWRPLVDRAAEDTATDADTIEAIVLLESAGRPDVIAGSDPEGASGLTQILAGTAVDLLGMKVDLERTRSLTRRISRAEAAGEGGRAKRLRRLRRKTDQRFDPARALAATGRYLALARRRLGRDDLAVASYHMGIGNLETALARYGGDDSTSYARLYFDSTPLRHERAYEFLSSLGDDSATYLWRVRAAREIMRLHRERPDELRRLAELHDSGGSAARRLRLGDGDRALAAPSGDAAKLGLSVSRAAREPALRPEALSAALYIAAGTRAISGQAPLILARAGQGAGGSSAFDIQRRYTSRRQALAFEFLLDRLQALNLIAWRRGGTLIHVVVGSEAGDLLPSPERLARDASREG